MNERNIALKIISIDQTMNTEKEKGENESILTAIDIMVVLDNAKIL